MADQTIARGLDDIDIQQPYDAFVRDNQTRATRVDYAAALEQFPANGTLLTFLPPDLIGMILSYLLEDEYRIDITLRDRKPGRLSSFKNFFPGFDQRPIFNVCEELTEHCVEFLFSSNKFYSKNATTFQDLPRAMGGDWVSQIRHLEVKNHFLLVTEHHRGPRQLEFIINSMPRLTTFRLTNDFDETAFAHESTTGKNRTWQERRALLEMGAFLILRHPRLDLLIWPADSGVNQNYRIWLSIEFKSKGLRRGAGGQILNSKAIRRYSWTELHDTPLQTFFLPDDAETSEGPEPDLFLEEDCKLIDRYGYMTPATQRQQGNKGAAHSLPKMIHRAKQNMNLHIREKKDQEVKMRRDTMDLQQMADMTIGRRGKHGKSDRATRGSAHGFAGDTHGSDVRHAEKSASRNFDINTLPLPNWGQAERGGLFGNHGLLRHGGATSLYRSDCPALNAAPNQTAASITPSPLSNTPQSRSTAIREEDAKVGGGRCRGRGGHRRGDSSRSTNDRKREVSNDGKVGEEAWPALGSGPTRRHRR